MPNKQSPGNDNNSKNDQSNKDYLESENEAAELAMREEIISCIMALPPEMQIEASLGVMTIIMQHLSEEAVLALRKQITDELSEELGELNALRLLLS